MTALFSSDSTVKVPRLVVALIVVVLIAGAVSFAISGIGPAVSLPAAVVFGMGLFYNGARRYEVVEDRIRTVGILGQRELFFEKIHAFEDTQPESFASRLQSLLTGAPPSSAIEVRAEQSFFSRQNYLWVQDREAFLQAAREALAAWTATRTIGARPGN